MKRFWKASKRAAKFNDQQFMIVIALTLLNLAACADRDPGKQTPWWLWLICVLIYPSMAFLANLAHEWGKD